MVSVGVFKLGKIDLSILGWRLMVHSIRRKMMINWSSVSSMSSMAQSRVWSTMQYVSGTDISACIIHTTMKKCRHLFWLNSTCMLTFSFCFVNVTNTLTDQCYCVCRVVLFLIYVSQGSVATFLRCSENYKNGLTPTVKEFWKSVNIANQSYV